MHGADLSLYNPLVPDDVLRLVIVGLLLGVALRAVRLHRDPTPLMICGYLFAAIVTFTVTWRWSAAVALHRPTLTYGWAYIAAAFVFCACIYVGKYAISRWIHRQRNKQTGPRLQRQLEQRRAERAAHQREQGRDR